MVSRKLMGVWAFFDLSLLAAGTLTVVMSMVLREPNLLLNMVFSNADLTGASFLNFFVLPRRDQLSHAAGLVLGVAFLVTFAISIGAVVQRNHVTIGLVVLNWALILDAIAIIVVGSFVWFFTLEERNNFHEIFSEQSQENKIAIQDKVCIMA
jgi:hypothetical protein